MPLLEECVRPSERLSAMTSHGKGVDFSGGAINELGRDFLVVGSSIPELLIEKIVSSGYVKQEHEARRRESSKFLLFVSSDLLDTFGLAIEVPA